MIGPKRPQVPEVIPLVQALYASTGGNVGCCLNIIIEDGNINTDHVRYCLELAEQEKHHECVRIAQLLMMMTKTQRWKLHNCQR